MRPARAGEEVRGVQFAGKDVSAAGFRVEHPHAPRHVGRMPPGMLPGEAEFLHADVGLGVVGRPPHQRSVAFGDAGTDARGKSASRSMATRSSQTSTPAASSAALAASTASLQLRR